MPARAAAELAAELSQRADFAGITAPVVVGCSGGADSLALLVLAAGAGLEPVAVHVDHGIRAGSAGESAVVDAAAARFGATHVAVGAAVDPGSNLEARARDARYAALDAARVQAGASWVLVGHTADDQAETVLLNVLRGAAATGLAGMSPRRDRVARPLLGVRRHETRALCECLGLGVVDDPMNEDPAFARVALRQRVLPMLEEIAGRDLVPVLARQAEVMRGESEYLDAVAGELWPGPGGPSARALATLEPVLARRAVRVWLGPPPPSSAEVGRVLEVARGTCRGAQLAGGRAVRRSGGLLTVERD